MAEAIETAKKYAEFNGSILIEGIESAERHGLVCKIVHSSLNELKIEVILARNDIFCCRNPFGNRCVECHW